MTRSPSARRGARAVVGSALVVLACATADVFSPGDLLVGTWSSADATLTATPNGATLVIPCIAAQFASLRLDDSLSFRVTGVVTQAGGMVPVRVGDPFPLSGRVSGDRVVIPWPWIAWNDGQDTLARGAGGVHVCNA